MADQEDSDIELGTHLRVPVDIEQTSEGRHTPTGETGIQKARTRRQARLEDEIEEIEESETVDPAGVGVTLEDLEKLTGAFREELAIRRQADREEDRYTRDRDRAAMQSELHSIKSWITDRMLDRTEDKAAPRRASANIEETPDIPPPRRDPRRPTTSTPVGPGSAPMETPGLSSVGAKRTVDDSLMTTMAYNPAARQAISSQPAMKFNGRTMDVRTWLTHFRVVARFNNWDPVQQALQLAAACEGRASNILKGLTPEQMGDYSYIVARLLGQFETHKSTKAYRSQLEARIRRHGESAEEYADELSTLAYGAYPNMDEDTAEGLVADRFTRGQTDPETRKFLWLTPQCGFRSLASKCVEFEAVHVPVSAHRPAAPLYAVEGSSTDLESEEELVSPQRGIMAAVDTRPKVRVAPRPAGSSTAGRGATPRGADTGRSPNPRRQRDMDDVQCYRCGGYGHIHRRCPYPAPHPSQFPPLEGTPKKTTGQGKSDRVRALDWEGSEN